MEPGQSELIGKGYPTNRESVVLINKIQIGEPKPPYLKNKQNKQNKFITFQ